LHYDALQLEATQLRASPSSV